MIYTSYFVKIKHGKGVRISIARFNPTWLKRNAISFCLPNLAPSKELLLDYKNGLTWEEYKNRYTLEIKESKIAIEDMKKIIAIVKRGLDVTLYCYEKPEDNCHRHLLAEMFRISGFEVEEIEC